MSNLISDIAQLQAVFKFLTHQGKPYWTGAVDGNFTEELGNKIREFERNEKIPVSGYISPLGVDLTLQRIRDKCKGTPYAKMHGLPDSSIVFSVGNAQGINIRKPLSNMDLWQAAGNDASAHVQAAANDLLLPMAVTKDNWSDFEMGGKTHQKFIISTPKVLWYSKTRAAFTPEIPGEADQYIKNYISKNGSYAGLSDKMTFITGENYKNPEELNELFDDYSLERKKGDLLHEDMNKKVKEINEIVKTFQDENDKHRGDMDKALTNATNVASIGLIKLSHKVRNKGVGYQEEIENNINDKFEKIEKNIKKELKNNGKKLGSYGKNLKAVQAYISDNGKTITRRGKVFFKFIDKFSTWVDLAYVYYDIAEYAVFLVESVAKLPTLKSLQKDVLILAEKIQINEDKLTDLAEKMEGKGVNFVPVK